MDVLEAIRSRRSVRSYRGDPVPEDVLTQVLEAGRWAPSSGNRQPWEFVVVREEKVRLRLAEMAPFGRFMAEAPVTVAVVVDPQGSSHAVEDGAAASQNILLAAHALGLGSCWIGSYGSSYEDSAKDVLGIPPSRRILSLISVGYAAESPRAGRRDLSEVVSYERYGGE